MHTNEKLNSALLSFGTVVFAFFGVLILSDILSDQEFYLTDSLHVFVLVGLFAAPLLLWHVFDLVDRSTEASNILKRAASLPAMVSLTLSALFLLVAMLFGLGHYNSCDELDGVLYHSCRIGTSLWVMIPFWTIGCVAWLLSFVKAALSIGSRLRGSPAPPPNHPVAPAKTGD